MKKILLTCIALPLFLVLYLGYSRYTHNFTSIVPYPFSFQKIKVPTKEEIKAPIVIIGDALALRLSSFKDTLAAKISVNLSAPIKIKTLAANGQNIHRTLNKLKNLKKPPLIIIILTSTDDKYEYLFATKDIPLIRNNFKLYDNLYLQTLLHIEPKLSKILYSKVNYSLLKNQPVKDTRKFTSSSQIQRSGLHLKLYEAALDELLVYANNSSSILIPITTPINLHSAPSESCYGSIEEEFGESQKEVRELVKKEDFKAAYNPSKDLTLLAPYNTQVNFQHGRIAFKLNKFEEAQKHLELAVIYDCGNKRSSPIYNVILKKIAARHEVSLLDFHQYLVDESRKNHIFLDDIYPQDYYFEKLTDILAQKIKSTLRL